MTPQSAKYSKHRIEAFRKAAIEWDKELDRQVVRKYELLDKPLPPQHESLEAARIALEHQRQAWKAQMTEGGKPGAVMGIQDAVDIMIGHVAMTVSIAGKPSLLVYNYDTGIYEYGVDTLNVYVVALLGKSSNTVMNSVVMTLLGRAHDLAEYNTLPSHRIGVGNGIFNVVTGKLEPYTPVWTTLTKIDTDYEPGYKLPERFGSMTFDKLCGDLSNYNPARIELLHQICKAVVTGFNVAPAMFIIQGDGGDGKSTFFTMLANMIGQNNVAYLNFSDFGSQDKLIECVNAKLVLGLDNDANVYIKQTAMMKSMASHETVSLSRKYLTAIAAQFTATLVQICNEMPRFAEQTESIERRVVVFKAENSHYKHGTQDVTYDKKVKDPEFLKHVLSTILDESHVAYYTNYSEVDKLTLEDVLNIDDVVGQFMSDLDLLGVFGEHTTAIPMSHLFTAYQSWLKSAAPGTSGLSSRGFALKTARYLKKYGFARDNNRPPIRPSALENAGEYSSAVFGYLKDSVAFDDILKANAPTRVVTRQFDRAKDANDVSSADRRFARKCSAFEFFNIDEAILEFMKTKHPELYRQYRCEEAKISDESATIPANVISINNVSDVAKLTQSPANLVSAYESKDIAAMDKIIDWLRKLESLSSGGPELVNTAKLSAYDNLAMQAEQVTARSSNPALLLMSQNITSAASENTAEELIKFIEEVKKLFKSKNASKGQES